jgi:hypothetical protein
MMNMDIVYTSAASLGEPYSFLIIMIPLSEKVLLKRQHSIKILGILLNIRKI